MFIELNLYDLIEAAIDGGKTFVHLFAEATDLNAHVADLIVHLGAEGADLVAYVSADVLAFLLDETRKFLENVATEPFPGNSESMAALIKAETENWGKYVRLARIEPQ